MVKLPCCSTSNRQQQDSIYQSAPMLECSCAQELINATLLHPTLLSCTYSLACLALQTACFVRRVNRCTKLCSKMVLLNLLSISMPSRVVNDLCKYSQVFSCTPGQYYSIIRDGLLLVSPLYRVFAWDMQALLVQQVSKRLFRGLIVLSQFTLAFSCSQLFFLSVHSLIYQMFVFSWGLIITKVLINIS